MRQLSGSAHLTRQSGTHRTSKCWLTEPFSVITSFNRISKWTLPCWTWGEWPVRSYKLLKSWDLSLTPVHKKKVESQKTKTSAVVCACEKMNTSNGIFNPSNYQLWYSFNFYYIYQRWPSGWDQIKLSLNTTKRYFTKQHFTKHNDIFKITTQNTMTSQHFTKHSRKNNISQNTTAFSSKQNNISQNTTFQITERFGQYLSLVRV